VIANGRFQHDDAICCGALRREWHIASIRGNAALRSLSERSGQAVSVGAPVETLATNGKQV